MRKILIVVIVLLSVFLIYLGFSDKKTYYLSLGDFLSLGENGYGIYDYGYSDFVKDFLTDNDLLQTYVDSLNRENKRIIDVINDINSNAKLLVNSKEKTMQNALIKSDLITISIGSNDLFSNTTIGSEFNIRNLYDKFDSLLADYEKLLKLLRQYCKEDIVLIGLYNMTSADLDEFFKYADSELLELCNKYNISYVKISEEFKNNKYFDTNLKIPNKQGYEYISKQIIKLIKNK